MLTDPDTWILQIAWKFFAFWLLFFLTTILTWHWYSEAGAANTTRKQFFRQIWDTCSSGGPWWAFKTPSALWIRFDSSKAAWRRNLELCAPWLIPAVCHLCWQRNNRHTLCDNVFHWLNLSLFMEDDNFDTQAANISVKPEICTRQMTHETTLSCVRLQNNVSMAENAALAEHCSPHHSTSRMC